MRFHCLQRFVRDVVAGVLLTALACGSAGAQWQNVHLFAAISMKDVLEEIVRGFDPGPNTRVLSAFAASSALARQIEHGAPADVFVSADEEWMDYLAQRKLIATDTRRVLAGNRLVLVADARRVLEVRIESGFPLAQLLGDGRLAVADPAHVPAGRYARAALTSLGVWPAVSGRLAAADNVRAALNFVARGEAPLGIVYQTDAAREPRVRIAGTFPSGSHPPIAYPAALSAKSARSDAARRLLAHLGSAEATHVFARHGFTPGR
jgi:molybdate transport system substrate-binding protein